MAITIQAGAGHASANSFITEAEFIAFLAERPNPHTDATVTGSTCTEAEKAAMVQATRELNVQDWKGSRVNSTQRLALPRAYFVNPDPPNDAESSLDDVIYFAEDAIPARVKEACCELAMQFAKAGTTDLSMPDGTDGVQRKKVDVLETEYFAHRATKGLARYPYVHALIAPLLAAGAGGLTVTRA